VVAAVVANDTDPDGDALSLSSVTQGSQGTVTHDGLVATYTPGAGYTGGDSFTYIVSDGQGGTATATVTVTVVGGGECAAGRGRRQCHDGRRSGGGGGRAGQ
jgi:hypothetical protein